MTKASVARLKVIKEELKAAEESARIRKEWVKKRLVLRQEKLQSVRLRPQKVENAEDKVAHKMWEK